MEGHAFVLMVVLGGCVDTVSAARWEMSQLLHAWSFPSTDLHLDKKASFKIKGTHFREISEIIIAPHTVACLR